MNWQTLRTVLGNVYNATPDVNTADDFATFFKNKVKSLRLLLLCR